MNLKSIVFISTMSLLNVACSSAKDAQPAPTPTPTPTPTPAAPATPNTPVTLGAPVPTSANSNPTNDTQNAFKIIDRELSRLTINGYPYLLFIMNPNDPTVEITTMTINDKPASAQTLGSENAVDFLGRCTEKIFDKFFFEADDSYKTSLRKKSAPFFNRAYCYYIEGYNFSQYKETGTNIRFTFSKNSLPIGTFTLKIKPD